jgi:hypothetical protein
MTINDFITDKIKIESSEYVKINNGNGSAVEASIATWYKANLKTSKLPLLPTTCEVDGSHKTAGELAETFDETGDIKYYNHKNECINIDLNRLNQQIRFISDDSNFLFNNPITVREITDDNIIEDPSLSKYSLFIEEGKHRSTAICYLLRTGKFKEAKIPIVFARAKDDLITRTGVREL